MNHEKIPVSVSKGDALVADRLVALNKKELHAVLATESSGQPYTSLVAYALTPDARGILFITPRRTRKYRNIVRNSRVSLLIDTRRNTEDDYMSAESITILGIARPVRKGKKWLALAQIFAKKHPKLKKITSSPETALILVQITLGIHVTSFQRVTIWKTGDILSR